MQPLVYEGEGWDHPRAIRLPRTCTRNANVNDRDPWSFVIAKSISRTEGGFIFTNSPRPVLGEMSLDSSPLTTTTFATWSFNRNRQDRTRAGSENFDRDTLAVSRLRVRKRVVESKRPSPNETHWPIDSASHHSWPPRPPLLRTFLPDVCCRCSLVPDRTCGLVSPISFDESNHHSHSCNVTSRKWCFLFWTPLNWVTRISIVFDNVSRHWMISRELVMILYYRYSRVSLFWHWRVWTVRRWVETNVRSR